MSRGRESEVPVMTGEKRQEGESMKMRKLPASGLVCMWPASGEEGRCNNERETTGCRPRE